MKRFCIKLSCYPRSAQHARYIAGCTQYMACNSIQYNTWTQDFVIHAQGYQSIDGLLKLGWYRLQTTPAMWWVNSRLRALHQPGLHSARAFPEFLSRKGNCLKGTLSLPLEAQRASMMRNVFRFVVLRPSRSDLHWKNRSKIEFT